MTDPVIENVRRSLGRPAQAPLAPRPTVYPPRRPGSTEAEIELFLDEVNKLAGVGQRLAAGQVEAALKALVAEQTIRAATLWDTPYLRQLAELLQQLGVSLVAPNAEKQALAQCDLGVTEADFILPETGTLVLRSSAEKPRTVSLVPRIHLAVVTPAALHADLHQVFAEAKDSRYLVFITGPSRTSDIELTLTLGVHGPQNLFVWVMDK